MARAVSQVSRSTRTRLTILRRILVLAAFLVVAAIVLAQFTSPGRLAAGVFCAPPAARGLTSASPPKTTIPNVTAGFLTAIPQPIRIGDRIAFEDREGRV